MNNEIKTLMEAMESLAEKIKQLVAEEAAQKPDTPPAGDVPPTDETAASEVAQQQQQDIPTGGEQPKVSGLDKPVREDHLRDPRKYGPGSFRENLTYRHIIRYILESCFPLYEEEAPLVAIYASVQQHIRRARAHVIPNQTGIRYALHLCGVHFFEAGHTPCVNLRPLFEKAHSEGEA